MHYCAHTLLDFNGGASCVQIYVNQHDFSLNKVRDTADHNDDLLWNTASIPDESPPNTESGLAVVRRNQSNCCSGITDRPGSIPKPTICHAGFPTACFCSVCKTADPLSNTNSV
ncbi:hypothetical protein K503DRAFT_765321 [Rhizopogon vinicolor AM-OR11-026]|uniref:Exocyst complex component Sec10-like alpha-helical bundle domain-containing protein n=1 Tax=Rhizopogon vinicolor AM-OR11-026 TaxID=1314800 RepID=A0A1B7NGK4_9AGAM|nr:hypothetical protein K503DRAFT_765321 [Rhizopogon vinicolor AM-OR11-026]